MLSEADAPDQAVFPLSHGMPRVDDRRVFSGILFVIRNGLRRRDVPRKYGPHKTIYNRFILGVFTGFSLPCRAKAAPRPTDDRCHALKAHQTAASLLKKGSIPMYRARAGRTDH